MANWDRFFEVSSEHIPSESIMVHSEETNQPLEMIMNQAGDNECESLLNEVRHEAFANSRVVEFWVNLFDSICDHAMSGEEVEIGANRAGQSRWVDA